MNSTISKLLAFSIAITVLASSCNKSNGNEDLNNGKATVTLKMNGVGFTKMESNVSPKSLSKRSTVADAVQHQEVSFNDKYKVSATLTPISSRHPSLKGSTRAESVSNGAAIEPLPKGTEYEIAVYRKGDESSPLITKSFKHGINDSEISFDLEPGEYTFLASGYSNIGERSENCFRWKENINIIQGNKATLSIIVEYMFAQATITLDAEDIGKIEKIMYVDIKPQYNVNNVDINFLSGAITYGRLMGDSYYDLFSTQSPSSIWKSLPATIRTSFTNKGEINLYNVLINGIMGDVRLLNLTIEEGVKYDLQLKLGSKIEKTFKISGLEFAKANLVYDSTNDSYAFEESTWHPGSYFFPNYLKPKIGNGKNYKPSSVWNGNNGDPCGLVKPLNSWRLPTRSETEVLLANNNTLQSAFSYYPGGEGGVFFGTQVHPGSERYNLLYLSLNDYYYNSDHINTSPGNDGRYLLKNEAGGYSQLALSSKKSGIISSTGEPRILAAVNNMAISIRCVKN